MHLVAGVETTRLAEARAMAVVGVDALMQRAADGLAKVLLRELRGTRGLAYGATVVLLVGPGNNGGDGLFAGVRLLQRGVRVLALRVLGRAHPAGWQALLTAGGTEVDAAGAASALPQADLVVDAILGIGGNRRLDANLISLAEQVRRSGTPVVAVDLPTGLRAEPPFGEDHLPAGISVTFGTLKPAHVLEPARSACGTVELVDIGLGEVEPDLEAWTAADVLARWPVPGPGDDKYSRGVVGIDAGSQTYPGAGVLAAAGALGAGAGMVRYLGPQEVASCVLARFPSVVTGQGRVQSLVLGPGWGTRKGEGLLQRAVASGVPLVVDADAIGWFGKLGRAHPEVLLTPHAGELARLLAVERRQVSEDPLAAAEAAANRWNVTVLLKGATQVIAGPGARTAVAVPGPAWTAQAGSGDVLAGICGALLAAGRPAATAAALAASIQAMAAEALPGPRTPEVLASTLASVIGYRR